MTTKDIRKKDSSSKSRPVHSENEESLSFIFREIEHGTSEKMTEEHIGEVLSQRRKVHEYIHKENMQFHERYKIDQANSLWKMLIVIVFAIFMLVLVAVIMPEYLPEALALVVGFVGGFGIGKSAKDLPIQNDRT